MSYSVYNPQKDQETSRNGYITDIVTGEIKENYKEVTVKDASTGSYSINYLDETGASYTKGGDERFNQYEPHEVSLGMDPAGPAGIATDEATPPTLTPPTHAGYAILTVFDADLIFTVDGTPPDWGASIGSPASAGSDIILDTRADIDNFQALTRPGEDGKLSVKYYNREPNGSV